jgi:hypothetical protein
MASKSVATTSWPTRSNRPGGCLLVEDADYCSLVAADPAHARSPSFNVTMRKLLAFIAAGTAFDPFFGRRLPGLVASFNLADAGHEAIACHRRGADSAAEVLARSLERTSDQALRHAAVGHGEFAAVLSAPRDPSFGFIDALSIAAWGPGIQHGRGTRGLARSTRQRGVPLTWDQWSGSYLKESWSLVR